jgi:class 3 adenylate cyclase
MVAALTKRFLARSLTRLQVSISAIFALLILPALGLVIAFSYHENVRNLTGLSQRFIDRARDDAVEMSANLLEPVGATLRLLAAAEEATPGLFRADESANVLYLALISAPQIDAVYATFQDGYHRVVTRMDDDRRRSDPRIPSNANWHSSFIDSFTAGGDRMRHRSFYETWPTRLGGYSAVTSLDVRKAAPQYQLAQQSMALAVSDPFINPDTGSPVIALGYPIKVEENFVGVASAQITLNGLSDLLAKHKASANSVTVIADQNGKVLAHPVPGTAVRKVDGQLRLTDLEKLDDPQIVAAVRQHASGNANRFTFELEPEGKEYVALFSEFPAGSGKNWQGIVVTPTDDFVGELKRTNRKLIWLMLALVLLESALIYFMARQVSRPIEMVSETMQRIRSLSFGDRIPSDSRIHEIAQLQRATTLLDNALRSFALFAPVGIVRELIESGQSLAPGMEQRFMTMLFTDVESFTSIAEHLSPQELSEQTSRYFENITSAVAQEGGTIDKFIGDSVMAFWGAPTAIDDHVFRACVAALRASHRMKHLNAQWAIEGRKQMRVRLGVHCDTVVVGNVGSPERLSYTVMGDGVNVASRIEGLNKQFGTLICISDSVYERVADRVVARALGHVPVKGRETEIMVYELLGIRGSDDPELSADEKAASRLRA